MQEKPIKSNFNKSKKIYTNYEICALCKGACCTRYAGIYSPDDFMEDITVKFIVEKLLTGRFAIDWMEKCLTVFDTPNEENGNYYYLRPRHIEEPAISGSFMGGICVNWSYDKGCSLPEQNRPYMCRTLVPLLDGETCSHKKEDKADKNQMIIRWIPFQDVLIEAIKAYAKYCK